MHRLRTWTQGHVEVLRAWQRQTAKHFTDWPRLMALYAHLQALPLAQQTHWRRYCKATLWGVALSLAASGVQPVLADTITLDGGCTLVNAIITANSDINAVGCVQTGTVSAADTIVLTMDTTLTTANNSTYGPTGLPVVSSEITITGNGKKILRDLGTAAFRLLAINSAGNLTLQDTTLSGGRAAGSLGSIRFDYGGGILNYLGQLRLEGCTVTGNRASYGSDTVNLANSTISGNSAGRNGGGILILASDYSNGTMSIVNSTISGNSAGVVAEGWGCSTTLTAAAW